jgi:hypothetical protein
MSRKTELMPYQPPDLFARHALELTFRLLRNNRPQLAQALKQTLDELQELPSQHQGYVSEMHANTDVLSFLGASNIVQIVAALNEIAREALRKKNLPGEHMRLLSSLIEDWAALAEWILNHVTLDHVASH